MADLVLARTGQLEQSELAAVRSLLEDAFDGDLSDDDWEHCLGGMHVLVREEGRLVAHGALVQRRLLHGGRALRTGYVEGVAVRADARRRGHGGAVMAALEQLARDGDELAALSTSEAGAPLYDARGWLPWAGPTSVLAPAGLVRTPEDDDAVRVMPLSAPLDLHGELTCDWRSGDVW